MNINTKEYWDYRFASGDWEEKKGRTQTRLFAEEQIKHLHFQFDFTGTILDFGCGFGDAIPVYQAASPHALLIGMDISECAIAKCIERYGKIAKFIQGDYTKAPQADVIIASNVFEHLSNEFEIATSLLSKCHDLFIITPYREIITLGREHINSYDEEHFKALGSYVCTIFTSKGWGPSGWRSWLNQYPKNLIRPFIGKQIVRPKQQIMFHFVNKHFNSNCVNASSSERV